MVCGIQTRRRRRDQQWTCSESFESPVRFSVFLHFHPIPKMPRGTLEVLLVSAKGLDDTDFLSNMDPYAVLTCRTQEKKSSVAKGQGSSPEWNETFLFTVSSGVTEIRIKIMDSDNFSSDDCVGEAIIPLEPVFVEEAMPPAAYNVVKDEQYCGEIRVGLKFVPQENREKEFGDADNFGGWKESSFD